MKKILLILILLSCGALFGLNQQAARLQEKDLQLGYKNYLSQEPGVRIDIFNNLEFSGTPSSTHVIPKLELFNATFTPFEASSISANVKGFLKVERSGPYSLELASDDGALLYIDGKRVINNWGFHVFESKKAKLYLNEGVHFLLIRYQNRTAAAGLKLAWALEGEERKPMGEGDLFLAQNLPPQANPFSGPLAEKILRQNQLRALVLILLLLLIVFLIWRNQLTKELKQNSFWVAVGIFFVGFGLRWIHYWEHLYFRIHGIMDGGDNHYFLTLPINFVTSGEFVSLNCGNLGVLIPLVGLFYKFFHFFPGLHYFSLLVILSGAFLCLFPWLLLKRLGFAWVGLLAGLFLAVHPLLVEFDFPYVTSDPIGLFNFALALTLGVKALKDNKWSSYIFAALAFSFLPLTRTVYIPSAPIFAFLLVVLGKEKKRALVGFVLFLCVFIGYEFLARTVIKQPYYAYFLNDGYSATVIHRASDQPQNLLQMVLWLPRFLWDYAQLMFAKLLPESWGTLWLRATTAGLILVSTFFLALRQTRIFLFIAMVSGIYLFEISSYHLHPRLTLPVVFVLGLVLALGLKEMLGKRWVHRNLTYLTPLLLVLSLIPLSLNAKSWTKKSSEEKSFYQWVKQAAPEKSIILTDHLVDPWVVHEETQLPVFYEATVDQTLLVNGDVVPIQRLTFVEEQSQIPQFKKHTPTAQFFRHHPYVMDGLAQKGYRYLIVQDSFVHQLTSHDFEHRPAMSINPRDYELKKFKDYPGDSTKGIWELVRKKTKVKQISTWKEPKHPESLDRFLKPVY